MTKGNVKILQSLTAKTSKDSEHARKQKRDPKPDRTDGLRAQRQGKKRRKWDSVAPCCNLNHWRVPVAGERDEWKGSLVRQDGRVDQRAETKAKKKEEEQRK